MTAPRKIARRSLPLLALAATIGPAAADIINLSLAFQGARLVHFIVMVGIVLFILVHVGLTLIVPRTLLAMVVGRATEPRHIVTSEDAR